MALHRKVKRPQQRFGEYVSYLRTKRGYPQSKLVYLIYSQLDEDAPIDMQINETVIRRIESGVTVKIPRALITTLSKVLCSTPLQQAQLLLAADKNVCVSDGAEPSAADEVLNFVLYLLHAEARDLIDTLLQDRRAETLEVDELLQIVLNALTLICQRRKYQQ